jgi:hypothetical protein
MNTIFNTPVLLVSFISLNHFFKNKKQIKLYNCKSVVLPMFPLVFWKLNKITFFLFLLFFKAENVISRNIFASFISIKLRNIFKYNTIYDGRGIAFAEAEEYYVYPDIIKNNIRKIEKYVLKKSDKVIAITSEMFEVWKRYLDVDPKVKIIIPCTIGSAFELPLSSNIYNRGYFGFNKNDIIIVYSGSLAKWQSLDLLFNTFLEYKKSNKAIKLLLLCRNNDEIKFFLNSYPEVKNIFVAPEHVKNILSFCDYGALIREKSITNNVSSPTKFGEYLSCGLQIITNENISISKFVLKHQLGIVLPNYNISYKLSKPNSTQRLKSKKIAKKFFSNKSDSITLNYLKILS